MAREKNSKSKEKPAEEPGTRGSYASYRTKIDLGEDLFQEIEEEEAQAVESEANVPLSPSSSSEESLATIFNHSPENLQANILDQLHSARILIGEGLIDEAKRILHAVIMHDPGSAEGKQLLREIHEIELKQIFNEERSRRRVLGRDKPELILSNADSKEVLSLLDRDLALGLFEETGKKPRLELSILNEV